MCLRAVMPPSVQTAPNEKEKARVLHVHPFFYSTLFFLFHSVVQYYARNVSEVDVLL